MYKIPALEVKNLTVLHQKNLVLCDVNITVPCGVLLGIIGPNGAGKTTFLKSLLGLVEKKSGTVSIMGMSCNFQLNKIAYISQRSAIDWDFPLTVFDMVLMGCYGRLGWFKRPGKMEKEKAYRALDAVGLCEYADKAINVLSGGQQQRAFLARALLQEAHIYFLDEPFAGVDMVSEKIIITLFKKMRDEGKTIIVVHHDISTAALYFDWLLLLNKKCIACGPIEDVLTTQYLSQVYGSYSLLNVFNEKMRDVI